MGGRVRNYLTGGTNGYLDCNSDGLRYWALLIGGIGFGTPLETIIGQGLWWGSKGLPKRFSFREALTGDWGNYPSQKAEQEPILPTFFGV